MKKYRGQVFILAVILVVWTSSCRVGHSELGEDLLPPGDSVALFHDTIFDIMAYPVLSPHQRTSEYGLDPKRQYLAGEFRDTITGYSRASMVTQFNANGLFKNCANTEIDTILFFLHVDEYLGELDQEVTYRLYEFEERLALDTFYYSDFDLTGRFNPVPLAEITTMPVADTTHKMLITNQDFIDKFLAIADDTTYFRNDSIFKDYFNGLYITCESASGRGAMARLAMNSINTRLSVHYHNDSTEVDSTAGRDFKWAYFRINEYSSQKVNVFEHDYEGTYLASILGDENASCPWLYVQGMAGVNTRLSFNSLAEWLARSPIAIAKARLVFDVLPEELSGLPFDRLPYRLTMAVQVSDEQFDGLYDPVIMMAANKDGSFREFGGYLKAVSEGMFKDTTYAYAFKMPLHFQALVDGKVENNPILLQVDGPLVNPHAVKLWGNLPGNESRLRLEVTYLKL